MDDSEGGREVVREDGTAEDAEVGERPCCAGNLSPRLARRLERLSASAVMTFHVDQTADLEEVFSQVKTKGI